MARRSRVCSVGRDRQLGERMSCRVCVPPLPAVEGRGSPTSQLPIVFMRLPIRCNVDASTYSQRGDSSGCLEISTHTDFIVANVEVIVLTPRSQLGISRSSSTSSCSVSAGGALLVECPDAPDRGLVRSTACSVISPRSVGRAVVTFILVRAGLLSPQPIAGSGYGPRRRRRWWWRRW